MNKELSDIITKWVQKAKVEDIMNSLCNLSTLTDFQEILWKEIKSRMLSGDKK